MNDLLFELSGLLKSGGGFLPLIAFLGGFLTSLTPCSLSALPFIIAYLGGGEDSSTGRNLALSATYAAGNALSFGALGLAAAFLGRVLNFTGKWWYLALGILMILLALDQFGLVNLTKSFTKLGQRVKRNRYGALVFGMISGIFASPCATPVMIALMTMITTAQISPLAGLGLYLAFALGNAITVVAAGMVSGRVGFIKTQGYSKFSKLIEIGFGIIIFAFGMFLIYEGL